MIAKDLIKELEKAGLFHGSYKEADILNNAILSVVPEYNKVESYHISKIINQLYKTQVDYGSNIMTLTKFIQSKI